MCLRLPKQCMLLVAQLGEARARRALAVEMGALWRGAAHAQDLAHAAIRDQFSPWYFVGRWAQKIPNLPALIDEAGEVTWLQLHERAAALAAALARHGPIAGSAVLLIAENSSSLVVALLAVQCAGGRPVLIDPASDAHWVAEAVRQSKAAAVWLAHEHLRRWIPDSIGVPVFVAEDATTRACACVTSAAHWKSEAQKQKRTRTPVGRDVFALLLTSGTTGTPRLVPISNYRAVLSGYGIGRVCLRHGNGNVIYCALPLSHATALLTGLCAALVTGSGCALRARFSAGGFWSDVVRFRATSALYVGETARRLLAAPDSDCDRGHGLQVLYGTGMPLDVWHRIQARFGVPSIIEFYGATELPLAMVNLSAEPGYMGRIALRELSPWQVERLAGETELVRKGRRGSSNVWCEHQSGELVFMGHYHTGDVVRCEAHGYVRHVDRATGVFRQDGHNSSCESLRTALRGIHGVRDVGVTHLTLPRYDGQAGLVVLVPAFGFDLRHLAAAYQRLPKHQRPRLLRLTDALLLNRGLKFDALAYHRAGVDPEHVTDPLYAYGASGFVVIDSVIWRELRLGTFRF